MSDIFSPNKTSADLLVDYAQTAWQNNADPHFQQRFLLVYDLFIKARSYAILNKVFFFLALIAGVMVLVWPSIAVIFKDFGIQKSFLESAIVQTTITGLAALLFAAYSHYKKRQVHAENLMRYVIFSDLPTASIIEKILKEIERIDQGFVFSESIGKKNQESEGDGKSS